jgi:hypothetical protein
MSVTRKASLPDAKSLPLTKRVKTDAASQLYIIKNLMGTQADNTYKIGYVYAFQDAIDSKDIDLGATLLYLNKALQEDKDTFLKSLDILFGSFKKPATVTQFDLVRGLKFINDIYYNNDVLYVEKFEGETVTSIVRTAYEHYMKGTGNITPEIKQSIKKEFLDMMTTIVIPLLKKENLMQGKISEISLEKQIQEQQIAYHKKIGASDASWRIREDMHLPQEQYTREQQFKMWRDHKQYIQIYRTLEHDEFMFSNKSAKNALSELDKEIKQLANLVAITKLGEAKASLSQLNELAKNKKAMFHEVLKHADSIIELMKLGVGFSILSALSPQKFQEIITHSKAFTILLRNGFTFEYLSILSINKLSELSRKNLDEISLLRTQGIPLATLLEQSDDAIKLLVKHLDFLAQIKKYPKEFYKLITLVQARTETLDVVMDHPVGVLKFMDEKVISSIDDLLNFSSDNCENILTYADTFIELIKMKVISNISDLQYIYFDLPVILDNPEAVLQLIRSSDLTLKDLVDVQKYLSNDLAAYGMSIKIFDNVDTIIKWINKAIKNAVYSPQEALKKIAVLTDDEIQVLLDRSDKIAEMNINLIALLELNDQKKTIILNAMDRFIIRISDLINASKMTGSDAFKMIVELKEDDLTIIAGNGPQNNAIWQKKKSMFVQEYMMQQTKAASIDFKMDSKL